MRGLRVPRRHIDGAKLIISDTKVLLDPFTRHTILSQSHLIMLCYWKTTIPVRGACSDKL